MSQELLNNQTDDDNDMEDFIIIVAAVGYYMDTYLSKQPYRDDPLTGAEYVMRVVTRNGNRCIDMLRMESHVFLKLCKLMREKGLLKDTRFVSVEEQLAIFIMTIGHGHGNRIVADRFQHSGETISRHINNVLPAICQWGKEIVVPPDFNVVPPHIRNNTKYMPWFENCIGAIDGTHISAHVPASEQIPYRGRKSTVTQNVMCACSFDMRFTFVYTGWEGTANDSRIFMAAITKPELGFPHPPQGKYYVVDSGYPNMPGYLAPHRNERYHLSEFTRGRRPRRAKELFNQRHSSLRNVIERCFGVLKARFPILNKMPPFSLTKQRYIVAACCILHNYLRMERILDEIALPFEAEDVILVPENNQIQQQEERVEVDASTAGRRAMTDLRDDITRSLAIHHQVPL